MPDRPASIPGWPPRWSAPAPAPAQPTRTYNVQVAVVDLIDATDAEAATVELERRLTAAGFDVIEDQASTAFLSDVDTEGNPQ